MLETALKDSVTIRIVERRHARAMRDFVERGREGFAPWIPFVGKTRTVEGIEALIQRYLEKFAKGEGVFYGLWDGQAMIGLVLVREVDEEARWAEIGYMVEEAYRGRGFAKAACLRLLHHLFGELDMQKAVIRCHARNEPSAGLARSLGFVHEGTLRRDASINGELCDTMCFGLLREEFRG